MMDRKKAADLAYAEGYRLGSASRDAEVAELQKAIDENWVTHQQIVAASKERDQLRANIISLIGSLIRAANYIDVLGGTSGEYRKAVMLTPKQSITEYRNKVIEDCAITIENCEPDEHGRLSIQEIAEAVSAMKEQP